MYGTYGFVSRHRIMRSTPAWVCYRCPLHLHFVYITALSPSGVMWCASSHMPRGVLYHDLLGLQLPQPDLQYASADLVCYLLPSALRQGYP